MPAPTTTTREATSRTDLAAQETRIGRADKTDPEMPAFRPQSTTESTTAPELAGASMPAATRAPSRSRQVAADRAAQTAYQALANPEEQRAFREFSKQYRQLEKRLVELESPRPEKTSSGMLNALAGFLSKTSDWLELRSVKSQMKKIRKEEQKLFDLVHERAEENNTRFVRITKNTPAIIQRASVPTSKQGHMPRYLALHESIAAQVAERSTVEKPLSIASKDQLFVISRKNEAGQTESMMFSYREDGKVSYYRKGGTDTEWKREATIWNDNAYAISVAFMKGKPFPRIVKPDERVRRVLAPVEFDEDWNPAARASRSARR